MHIKGWEGRRSGDLAISVIGVCVREVDMEEGKGRGEKWEIGGERKREGWGRERKGEEGGERGGREKRENTENSMDGMKAYRAGETLSSLFRLKLN